jgi:hypothetical protein
VNDKFVIVRRSVATSPLRRRGTWNSCQGKEGGEGDELTMDGDDIASLLSCRVVFIDGGGDVEGCSLMFGQNSHSWNLPTSFLGNCLHRWYVVHKIYMYNKAFVVQLVEHLCSVLWQCS